MRCSRLLPLFVSLVAWALPGLSAEVVVSTDAPRPFEAMRGFVPYTEQPIALDGKLDAWMARPPILLLKKTTIAALGRIDGEITDDADLTVTLWLAWDQQNLYLLVDVIDRQMIGGMPGVNYDGVLLGLGSPRYPAKIALQYCLNYYPPGAPTPALRGKGRYAVAETDTGYRLIATLPFTGMKLAPAPGLRINWYLVAIDRDLHALGRLLAVGTPGATAGSYFCAELRLLPPQTTDFAGDLRVNPTKINSGATLQAQATIDARADGGTVSEARFEDAHGVVRWRAPLHIPLPKGACLPVRLRLTPPKLATGAYRLVICYGKARACGEAAAAFTVK